MQLFYAGESFLLNAAQAVFVRSPLCGGTLVAAYVYIWEGENLRDIVQYAFKELYYSVVANVQNILRYSAVNAYRVFFCRVAAELGVGGNCGYHVSGHVNLGQDIYIEFAGILYYFAQVVLREPHSATILCVVKEFCAIAGVAERARTY